MRVDLSATADALTRRIIDISRVRTQVNTLTGPVRARADQAMRDVTASLTTQIQALESYNGHVQRLDQQLRDADSTVAAGAVFDSIRGLYASTVEDELDTPRLQETGDLAQATTQAIARMTAEAAADLDRLLGVPNPSLPRLG